jgi:hypothetical protein
VAAALGQLPCSDAMDDHQTNLHADSRLDCAQSAPVRKEQGCVWIAARSRQLSQLYKCLAADIVPMVTGECVGQYDMIHVQNRTIRVSSTVA